MLRPWVANRTGVRNYDGRVLRRNRNIPAGAYPEWSTTWNSSHAPDNVSSRRNSEGGNQHTLDLIGSPDSFSQAE